MLTLLYKPPSPRLKRYRGEWVCLGSKVSGNGQTPKDAYFCWQLAFACYWER